MNYNDIEKLLELQLDFHTQQTGWYQQMLTVAAGGLALLVGLNPDIPEGMARYFLALAWAGLGIGIVAGFAAAYGSVSRAGRLARDFRDKLLKAAWDNRRLTTDDISVAAPKKIYVYARKVTVVSLLVSVASLVAFAMLRTLG